MKNFLISLFASIFIAGCGGSDGSSNSTAADSNCAQPATLGSTSFGGGCFK